MISREQLAEENEMSIDFVNWFFNNKKDGCGNAWFMMMAVMWEGWKCNEQKLTDMAVQLANSESKCWELAAVVAENAALKNPDNWLSQSDYGYEAAEVATQNGATEDESLRAGMIAIINRIKTPSTDAFLAEVRASARNEGINYAASRLAAAFNHGFVDKPLAEVCDVVRMILDTKEELANSTLPAADGISGEYAEKFLAEFAAQLRKGAKS